jgi:hypothetical protein
MELLRVLQQSWLHTVAVSDGNVILKIIVKKFVLLTQYCAGDKIEKNEMSWACGAYG